MWLKTKSKPNLEDIEMKITYLRSIALALINLADKLEKQERSDGYVLVIDRTRPFEPAKFIGDGWKIIEQDKASLVRSEIGFAAVSFETCLNTGETYITGEEKLIRHAKAGHILADAKIGQALYEEVDQKTLKYLYKEKGIIWFELPGTVLRGPSGRRYTLYLYRCVGGRWDWGYGWLDLGRGAGRSSLVLAST